MQIKLVWNISFSTSLILAVLTLHSVIYWLDLEHFVRSISYTCVPASTIKASGNKNKQHICKICVTSYIYSHHITFKSYIYIYSIHLVSIYCMILRACSQN